MINYTARTYEGLESILATELENIGASKIEIGRRHVSYEGTVRSMYRANYELRTAIRILQPIASFKLSEAQDLYKKALDIRWDKYFDPEQSFKINKQVFSDFFSNTNYAALILKDAIVDYFRKHHDLRPTVDRKSPNIVIDLHVDQKNVTISLDTSGDSLHLRGYKSQQTYAPISEVLAAGMIMMAKAEKYPSFVNPMCGSGTIAIEANNYLRKVPAQISRKFFSFFNHKSFDEELWNLVKKGAKMRMHRSSDYEISAYDWSENAFKAARSNAHSAGCFRGINIQKANFFRLEPPQGRALVMINPPYDKRLELKESLKFHKSIGNRLKEAYKGKDVWIISAAIDDMKKIGLKAKKSLVLNNGPIKCVFNKYEVY